MLKLPVPYDKLSSLRESLALSEEELKSIEPFRDLFIEKKDEFALYLYQFFSAIPETRIILDRAQRPGFFPEAWSRWFELLFRERPGPEFFSRLWKVGLRHVEVALDQRYTNLGFSMVRQYCYHIVFSSIPVEKVRPVLVVIDKLLDLCLLIETSAYIDATTQCDLEVINGIADMIRNPVTVIGGNIKRLQRKVDPGDPLYSTYESLISENMRLERMVKDIKVYIEMLNTEPELHTLLLEELIISTLERLRLERDLRGVQINIDLDPRYPRVLGDRKDLGHMFYHLLQNSLDAVEPDNARVRISSYPEGMSNKGLAIELFNTGKPPKAGDLDKLYSPFFTTKPTGTGFGLPIAKLAVRKNHGKLMFVPVPGEGVKVIGTITLPG